MTLSPTVPGVLLFVICFASSAAASHPGNHDDPAGTSARNNEGKGKPDTLLPWKAIFSYRSSWPKGNVTAGHWDGKPRKATENKDISQFAGRFNGRHTFHGGNGEGSHARCKKDAKMDSAIARRRVTRRAGHDHRDGQRWSRRTSWTMTTTRSESFSERTPSTIVMVVVVVTVLVVIVVLVKYCQVQNSREDDPASGRAAARRPTARPPPPGVGTGSSRTQPSASASRMRHSLRREEEQRIRREEEQRIRSPHPLVDPMRNASQNAFDPTAADVPSWSGRTVTPGCVATPSSPTGSHTVGGPPTPDTRIHSSGEAGRYPPPPEVGTVSGSSFTQPSAFALRMSASLRRNEEERIRSAHPLVNPAFQNTLNRTASDAPPSSERTVTLGSMATPSSPTGSNMVGGPPTPPSAFARRMRHSLRRDEERSVGSTSAPDVLHVSSEETPTGTPGDTPTESTPMRGGPRTPSTRNYLSIISEDSDRFVQVQNPLAVADRESERSSRNSSREVVHSTSTAWGDGGSSSGTRTYSGAGSAWRPAPGGDGRGGDRPPDYAEVVMADLLSLSGAEFGTARRTYDPVEYDRDTYDPEEHPPPSYDDAHLQADGALAPP